MDVRKFDKNMIAYTKIAKDGLVFYTPEHEAIGLHGVFKTDRGYCRMTPSCADGISGGVSGLNFNTSGGRVRFVTDSKRVAIIAKRNTSYNPDHMTYINVAGFDIYADGEYHSTFRPGSSTTGEQSFESSTTFDCSQDRLITINFPCYGPVSEFMVGIDEGASLKSAPTYKYDKPVIFYGSSVTQGGCCTRPGLNYPTVLSRMLDADYINLGFSGSCKGELAMADYIGGLDASVLVMGFDHNAPSPEFLAEHHEPFFKRVRELKPDLPVVLITRPRFKADPDRDARLAVVKKTYDNAISAGDKNVYFVPTPKSLVPIGNDGTVDGCHPNDLGFWFMAQGLYPTLREILEKSIENK